LLAVARGTGVLRCVQRESGAKIRVMATQLAVGDFISVRLADLDVWVLRRVAALTSDFFTVTPTDRCLARYRLADEGQTWSNETIRVRASGPQPFASA
jgi:hypothetical protein